MNPLKKLAGQTAIYGLSSIIGRAVNFLLVPFYANKSVLSAAEFGIMTEYYAYIAFFNVVYLFGMETTYFRFANKGNEQKAFNNALSFILFLSSALSLLVILLSGNVAGLLQDSGNAQFITWLALVLWVDALAAIPFAKLRFLGKAKQFAGIKLLNIGLNVGLNLFFLLFCKGIWEGRFLVEWKEFISLFYNPDLGVGYVFLSNLLANLVFIPLLLPTFKGFALQFHADYIRPMLHYALPLVFVGFAGMINEMLDRILLKELLPANFYSGKTNQEALGIYGAVYKVSMLVSLVNQAFRYAAEPFFFAKAKEKDSPKMYAEVLNWYVIFMCIAVVGISVFRELLGVVLLPNEVLREGLWILPFLLLANVFLGVYMNLSIWFKLTDKTYIGTIISIGAALFTVIFNVLLIPSLGYFGSAITTFLCYFIMSLVCYFWGNKHYPVPYNWQKTGKVLLLSVVFILPSYCCSFASLWQNTLVGILSFTVFLAVLYRLELKKLSIKSN